MPMQRSKSSQCATLLYVEKRQESVDSIGTCAALLTDIAKAFDCLPHELLIGKLEAYKDKISSLMIVVQQLREPRQNQVLFFKCVLEEK